jgi:iron transport multicopper oxidase
LLASFPVGTAAKFMPPGISGNKVFVGTRDGHILRFGAPIDLPLTGDPLSYPTTTVGGTNTQTERLTATKNVTVESISSSDSTHFSVGTPSTGLPASLHNGDTISVPVTFAPSAPGPVGGTLDVDTSDKPASIGMSGIGQCASAQLSAAPRVVSFGGAPTGAQLSNTVTFSNVGGTALTINAVDMPDAPFSTSGMPAPSDQLAPGQSITVNVTFQPTEGGGFNDQIGLETTGGTESVALSGNSTPPGHLEISPAGLHFGRVAPGWSKDGSFTITNSGGTPMTIMKSKPPETAPFAALTSLDEGSTVPAGSSTTEKVRFTPTSEGSFAASWAITGTTTPVPTSSSSPARAPTRR